MTMVIRVTQDDIDTARKRSFDHPISHALQRETGATWRIFEVSNGQIVAVEAIAPYRIATLPDEVREQWRASRATSRLSPFEFSTELTGGYC